jgi:phosphonate metabolism protein PhnN/1,5-bisphosphokinase (PRPP-forming)
VIFAVVGPSGAGKDTLIAGALARRPDLRLVRRVITRPTEAGGEAFDGVSETEFRQRLASGAFALHWQAHGLHYGIPRDQVTGPGDVIFNGSRAALPAALAAFPGLRIILVTAPAAILARRLAARGRETEADIRARLDRAAFALPPGIDATVVANDTTTEAGVARLLAALQPVRA